MKYLLVAVMQPGIHQTVTMNHISGHQDNRLIIYVHFTICFAVKYF